MSLVQAAAKRQARLISEAMAEPGAAAPPSDMVKEIVTILAKDKQQSTIEAARQIVEYVETERAKVWDETERDRVHRELAEATAQADVHRQRADQSEAERAQLRSDCDRLQEECSRLRAELATRDALPMLLRKHMPARGGEQAPVAIDLQPVIARLDGISGLISAPVSAHKRDLRVRVITRDINGAIERAAIEEVTG